MQLVMDMKNERAKTIKSEQLSSTKYNNYMESGHFDECPNSNPIDLSRRRDSVESRKTPSPSDSSMFGSSSPSILNDSPSTASLNINNNNSGSRSVGGGSNSSSTVHSSAHPRSDTPTHHYQSPTYMQQFRHSSAAFYPYQSKRNESPSPPDTLNAAIHHRHHMHDYAGVSAAVTQNSADEISPYILHAVALQQKLVQSQILERPSSNDSSTVGAGIPIPIAAPSNSTTFPMVLGRDGKLSRPFKAFPHDPLCITASLSAANSIFDRTSNEKYTAFRKQMMEQIYAANGGHPTVSNPKMRRTSAKAFVDNIAAAIPDVDQQQQQQQQRERELSMQQQQESQNNALSDSSSNGGGSSGKNATHKDSAYFERRKKNNAAAKKSRDRRRNKEDEIAIRAAWLQQENLELKCELEATKRQLAQFMAQSHSGVA